MPVQETTDRIGTNMRLDDVDALPVTRTKDGVRSVMLPD